CYFSDVCLASALIQQKSAVTKDELPNTFIFQQSLVITGLIIVATVYPSIATKNNYGSKETWILISLCFSFLAASLKTIPSVLLERQLNFKLISTIDIIENLLFYVVAVLFAFLGFGALSYAISTFARSLVGVILIYLYSPWPIGFSFSVNSAKRLFRFGIPFQVNSFIAVAKDRLSNLLVASIIGRESFGLLAWAQKGPRLPLSLMDAIMKVTFPTFSRLQDHPELLKKSLEKSTFFISLFVFPALVGISFIAPDVIMAIPKYTKWLPAVLPLYFYALNAGLAAVTTPLTNAFNAVGKISITTKLMIMWTVLTWIFYPLLSYRYGYMGTAVATLIVGSSSIIVWLISQKVFKLNVFYSILHPTIASLIMATCLYFVGFINYSPVINIITKIVLGTTVYCTYQLIFSRQEINWFWKQILCLVPKK
ncbi:oligosaccharide flippase family protein, partial [Candidatus Shapirobacteria bacterium]|nr:oligosaccharide flippase family protein [Candidatus Shapirobacteria bacterium]